MDNALLDLRYSNCGEIVKFNDLNRSKQKNANEIVNKVVKIASDAYGAEAVVDSNKKSINYVVNMSDKVKKAIEDGSIKLDTNKKGEIYAQIRDHGHYSDKFSIKKEITKQGLDPIEVSQALQQKAIENQLKEISNVIDDINCEVIEVIQGQQNDRLALFYSGIELYLEAQNIADDTLRKLMIAQSIKSISDGGSQILESTRSEIKYLIDGEYKKKKGKSEKDIDIHMKNINNSFQAVSYAYLTKAYIYHENNELQSMLLALEEYNKFLSNDIVPNAEQLIEFDRSDMMLTDGKWEKRSKQLDDISKIRKQISTNSSYSIMVPGGKKK